MPREPQWMQHVVASFHYRNWTAPRESCNITHSMQPAPRLPALLIALLISASGPRLLIGADPATDPEAAASAAWGDMGRLLQQEAAIGFERLHKHQPTREIQYGYAVSLINRQPKTQSNLDKALAIFADLQKEGDDLSVKSLYFKGRIHEYHDLEPDVTTALASYRELIAKYPDHTFAQIAATNLAFCLLYESTPPEEKARRVEELSQIASRLTLPAAKRELNRIIGGYLLMTEDKPAEALPYLVAASRIDFRRFTARIDNYVRIAEAARQVGQNDLAIEFYSKFLNETTRDNRAQLISERLESLKAAAGQGTSTTPDAAAPPPQTLPQTPPAQVSPTP